MGRDWFSGINLCRVPKNIENHCSAVLSGVGRRQPIAIEQPIQWHNRQSHYFAVFLRTWLIVIIQELFRFHSRASKYCNSQIRCFGIRISKRYVTFIIAYYKPMNLRSKQFFGFVYTISYIDHFSAINQVL